MSEQRFSVFERSLSYVAEPELIAKGLSYEEARDLAGSKMGNFIAHWSCNFEIKREARENGDLIIEATKAISGSSLSWGYRVTIEPEPAPKPKPEDTPEYKALRDKRFSLIDIRNAFGELSWNIQIKSENPERDLFLLSDIESDITRALGVQSGEVRFA